LTAKLQEKNPDPAKITGQIRKYHHVDGWLETGRMDGIQAAVLRIKIAPTWERANQLPPDLTLHIMIAPFRWVRSNRLHLPKWARGPARLSHLCNPRSGEKTK